MKRTFLSTMLLALGLQVTTGLAQEIKKGVIKPSALKGIKNLEGLQAIADGAGNGGDTCENRIKVISNDIEFWILREGSESLKLPSGLSHKEYDSRMLNKLRAGYPIVCTADKVYVGRAEKTCKNYEGSDGVSRIKCNLERFNNLSEENQYRLIHHEYAGLAGFEVNTGEESKYFISNQLAAYLENQVVKRLVIKRVADLNIELVPISGDTFNMGSPKGEGGRDDDEELRNVTIDYNFEMMTTEVTQDLYVKVTGVNPSRFKNKRDCPDTYKVVETEKWGLESLCPNHPVENVSYNEVIKFIALLNAKTGMNYRLPTEAEWELAARAGRQAAYFFGNNPKFLSEYAIFNGNSERQTQAVGPLRNYANKPNKNGLYDIHGNVWELVQEGSNHIVKAPIYVRRNVWEWVQDLYTESPSGGVNPVGSFAIAIRGGSWENAAGGLRSASRISYGYGYYDFRSFIVGFRLVSTLD